MGFDQLTISDDIMTNLFLTFRSEDEKFGLSIHEVREIISYQKITKVPEFPEFIRGIINLRGNVIPTIDVRNMFRQKEGQYHDHTCIIIVDISGLNTGLIVDEVLDVLNLSINDISELPDIYGTSTQTYISGIGKYENELYMLLECGRLFNESQIESYRNILDATQNE